MARAEYVEGLQQKIDGLMQYYFKGCANILSMISSHAQSTVEYKQKRDGFLDLAIQAHEKFKDNYVFFDPAESTVMIDNYSAPLLVLNKLVPKLNNVVDTFVAEPSEVSLGDVETMVNTVSVLGNKFRKGLIELQTRVRSFNGYKRYSVSAIDHNGNGWHDVL